MRQLILSTVSDHNMVTKQPTIPSIHRMTIIHRKDRSFCFLQDIPSCAVKNSRSFINECCTHVEEDEGTQSAASHPVS